MKHVIWDFDGTLFDTYPVMTEAMVSYLKTLGIDVSYETVYGKMKVAMSHLTNSLKEEYNLDDDFIERYKDHLRTMEEGTFKPFDGAIEILKKVNEKRSVNHLYTHRGLSAIRVLTDYDVIDLFEGLITRENGFERKPSPDAINYLIEEYKIDKDHAIMIGDREMDLLSAKNAGIKSCFFHEEGLISENGDYNIRDLKELLKILF